MSLPNLEKAKSFSSAVLKGVKGVGAESLRVGSDILLSVEAQLRGASLKDLIARGKLTALHVTGIMQESDVGALYQHRVRGLISTRRLLERIDEEFGNLTRDTVALGNRLEKVCQLLNQFRLTCDAHVVVSRQDEEALARQEASRDFVDVAEELDDCNGTAGLSLSTPEDATIAAFRDKMRAMLSELRETVELNCGGICKMAIHQIDEAHLTVVRDVTESRTTLDLHRRKVLSTTEQLAKLRDEIQKYADGSNAKSMRAMQLDQLEVSLHVKREEEASLRQVFQESVSKGLGQLHFALEQCSMSTWSVYNIFFTQMTNFLKDAAHQTETVSKAFVALKNSQGVSRRISHEKRVYLERQQQQQQQQSHQMQPSTSSSFESPMTARLDSQQVSDDAFFAAMSSVTVPAVQTAPTPEELPRLAGQTDDFESFLSQRLSSTGRAAEATTDSTLPPKPKDVWQDLFES